MGVKLTKILAENVDMSDDFVTEAALIGDADNYSIQCIFAGTLPTGELKIQMSNSLVSDAADIPENEWSDLVDTIIEIDDEGDMVWEMTSAPYRWVRVSYASTSGTGVFKATLVAKD